MPDPTGLLSSDQFRALEAICATLLPDGAQDAAVASLLTARVADLATSEDHHRFRQAVNLVESRLANLLLTGRFRRFTHLDRAGRERILRAWAASRYG